MYVWIERLRIGTRCAALPVLGLSLALVAASAAARGEAEAAAGAVRSDEGALLERAQAYWDARVERSREVLDFYAPPEKGGPKNARERSEFGNIGYRGAEVQGAEIDGDQAVVRIRVGVAFALITPLELGESFWTREIREKWLEVDGTWYKKPIPLGFSQPSPRPTKAPGPGRASTPTAAATSPDAGARP